MFIGGAVVQWLRDGLQIIRSASDIEALAASVPDNGGVYLVPAFAGLGAPHWDAYARGAMFGLTRGATRGHIARAALEAIAFQSADVLAAMEKDAGITLTELRVDGGAAANNLLHAVPGRPARRARRAAAGAGNDGARRGLPRGPCRGLLDEHRRHRRATGASTAASSLRCRRARVRIARALGQGGGADEGLG